LLKVHHRRGEGQGANLHKLPVNRLWKGRKADSRWVMSHSLKQGRQQTTKLIFPASEQHPKSNGFAKLKNKQKTIITC
jgi:hypothetical protein